MPLLDITDNKKLLTLSAQIYSSSGWVDDLTYSFVLSYSPTTEWGPRLETGIA